MRETYQIYATLVGRRLKELRGEATQAEFATRLGLKQAQYNRYETGKRLPPDRILERVGDLCGYSPQEVLWGRVQAAAPPPAAQDRLANRLWELVNLLDLESREDLYYFLKRKTEELARRREQEANQARAVLDDLLGLSQAG